MYVRARHLYSQAGSKDIGFRFFSFKLWQICSIVTSRDHYCFVTHFLFFFVAVQYSFGKIPLPEKSCYNSDRQEDENSRRSVYIPLSSELFLTLPTVQSALES